MMLNNFSRDSWPFMYLLLFGRLSLQVIFPSFKSSSLSHYQLAGILYISQMSVFIIKYVWWLISPILCFVSYSYSSWCLLDSRHFIILMKSIIYQFLMVTFSVFCLQNLCLTLSREDILLSFLQLYGFNFQLSLNFT